MLFRSLGLHFVRPVVAFSDVLGLFEDVVVKSSKYCHNYSEEEVLHPR